MSKSRKIFCTFFAFILASLAGHADVGTGTEIRKLRVAAYNLENLFDATHDENRLDWFYMPLSHPGKTQGCKDAGASFERACLVTDWTPEKAQLKIDQMKAALLSQGALPDILGVEEVENAAILGEFARAVGYSNF